MTVPVQTPVNSYTSSGGSTFVYSFEIIDAAHLTVTVNGTTKTNGVDYAVTGVGVQAGGTITGLTTIAGDVVVLQRIIPLARTTDYQANGDLLADTIDSDFDQIWRVLQQQAQIGAMNTVRGPSGETLTALVAAASRANMWLAFDASGNPYAAASIGSGPAVSAFMQTVLDDTTAAIARTTLAAAASGANTDITSLGVVARASFGAPSSTLLNGTIVHSRASNAETIAIKTLAGADPSASDPVAVVFRNATAATGDYSIIVITAATSITISSGSTMGATNSAAFRLWLVAFNDAGTLRLGVIKCASATGIYPLAGFGIASSTAEGGAGAADSAQVFYTGTAVTAKAYTVLGYSTWESGLAAVGTWGTAPTRIQLFGPGVKLPMDRIQCNTNTTAGGLASSSTSYVDITNATLSITPSSAANAVKVEARGQTGQSYNASFNTGSYVQTLEGATVIDGNYLHASSAGANGIGWFGPINQGALRFPNSAAALTYKLQQKASNLGGGETVTTASCNLYAEELMT